MSGLERISFKQGRTRLPRLSAPRVPGVHSDRFWTDPEKEIIRTYYPTGGSHACLAHLGPHRTPSGVYQQARKQGLTCPQGKADYKGANGKVAATDDIDDILREKYAQQDGKKRGAVNAIADVLKLPRWWVTKRAIKLGLTMPHRKEPDWTAAEIALLDKVPLHDPLRCSKIFRQHGFSRSPTSITVKATRRGLSRRFREGYSAIQAGEILGFDGKTMSTYCVDGQCKAEKRADNRLPQQGGSRWVISHDNLRRFVLDHLDRIDLRKVEKQAFVQLLINVPLEPDAPATPRQAEPRPRRIVDIARELSRALDEVLAEVPS